MCRGCRRVVKTHSGRPHGSHPSAPALKKSHNSGNVDGHHEVTTTIRHENCQLRCCWSSGGHLRCHNSRSIHTSAGRRSIILVGCCGGVPSYNALRGGGDSCLLLRVPGVRNNFVTRCPSPAGCGGSTLGTQPWTGPASTWSCCPVCSVRRPPLPWRRGRAPARRLRGSPRRYHG